MHVSRHFPLLIVLNEYPVPFSNGLYFVLLHLAKCFHLNLISPALWTWHHFFHVWVFCVRLISRTSTRGNTRERRHALDANTKQALLLISNDVTSEVVVKWFLRHDCCKIDNGWRKQVSVQYSWTSKPKVPGSNSGRSVDFSLTIHLSYGLWRC